MAYFGVQKGVKIGVFWAILGHFGPFWAGPGRSGPVRAGPAQTGPKGPNLSEAHKGVRAGPVRAGPGLARIGPFRSGSQALATAHQIGPFWAGLAQNGPK